MQAKDAAGDATGSAKDAAGDVAGSAKSAAGDAKGSGKDVLGDLKGKGKDLAGSVNEATPNLSANPFDDALGKVSVQQHDLVRYIDFPHSILLRQDTPAYIFDWKASRGEQPQNNASITDHVYWGCQFLYWPWRPLIIPAW